MAEEGATAEEIAKHYYTGVEISAADHVARSAFKRSLVLGRVVDGLGKPRPDSRLILRGPAGRLTKATTADGRFWFSKLPAGEWELIVKGESVRYRALTTDGRNTLDLQVVVPDNPLLQIRAIPLAFPNQLAGTLGYRGIQVTIIDSAGTERVVDSGSAPDFDPGGFARPISDGTTPLRYSSSGISSNRPPESWMRSVSGITRALSAGILVPPFCGEQQHYGTEPW